MADASEIVSLSKIDFPFVLTICSIVYPIITDCLKRKTVEICIIFCLKHLFIFYVARKAVEALVCSRT